MPSGASVGPSGILAADAILAANPFGDSLDQYLGLSGPTAWGSGGLSAWFCSG